MEEEKRPTDKRLLFEFRTYTIVLSLFVLAYILGITLTFRELGPSCVGAWIATCGFLGGIAGMIKCLTVTIKGIKFAKTFDPNLLHRDWDIMTNGLWIVVGSVMVALIGLVIGIKVG